MNRPHPAQLDLHELISISLMVLLDRVTSSRIKRSTYNHRADRVARKITSNMTPPEAAMYIPKEPVPLSEEGGRNCFVRCPRFGSVWRIEKMAFCSNAVLLNFPPSFSAH